MWPDIPYQPWRETCTALHLYTQVVGKYRLACTPWINHSWHATLYVNARGLTTSLVPDGPGGIEVVFDLIDHAVIGVATDGRTACFPLGPMSVADFHARVLDLVRALGGTPELHGRPNEVPDPMLFKQDHTERPYDTQAVARFFQVLVSVDRVLKRFRTAFIGKASPVHLFWGSFDLAVTRFSGRRAPERPGADSITRESYSHEVISHGWWPGSGAIAEPAFYAYAAPEPGGFKNAPVEPAAAFYSPDFSEFVLPYEAVRTAAAPEAELYRFLRTTYDAAATLAEWDRGALERA